MGRLAHQLPSLKEVCNDLLRNRTAMKLGLLAEGTAKQTKNEGRQLRALLEGEGSLLPLDTNWTDSEVKITP